MSADTSSPTTATWRLDVEDETELGALAVEIAGLVRAGDLVTLSGDLGAGKTALARALIRRLCDDPALETPSPTFTLMQIYEGAQFPIVHADLYRVQSPDELAELGWEDASDGALALVEWADRMGDSIAANRLDVALRIDPRRGETYREVTLTGHGAFGDRLERARALAQLLEHEQPQRYVANMSKAKRKGRIFVDYLRNERGSTAIAPYSTRARKGCPVATPVSWEELATIEAANTFHIGDMAARMAMNDPWAPAATWKQSLTKRLMAAVEATSA